MALIASEGQLALGLDAIAAEIHRVWDETKAHQVAAWEGYLRTGALLAEARRRFPADQEYGRWFAAQEFAFNTEWGRRLMIAASREIDVRSFLATAVASNPPGVNAVLTELGLLGGSGLAPLMSSDTPEWYTPRHVLDAVVAAMGGIDLDPCAEAAKSVPATRHFTEADDGLSQPWRGRVYMNPPYGKTIGAWVDKLGEEFDYGNVSEAIALVPARTDTSWWAHLPASMVCFITGRLSFSEHENPAPFPSAACYLGKNDRAFADAFLSLGLVYVRLEIAA